jgi:hypothetical protein
MNSNIDKNVKTGETGLGSLVGYNSKNLIFEKFRQNQKN